MELKIKKVLYCVAVIITAILAILLLTLTLHAAAHASALPWTGPVCSLMGDLTIYTSTYTSTDIKLLHESADTSSYNYISIKTILHWIKSKSSPLIMSVLPEGNKISDNVSSGEFASIPEPLTLLLMGTGLMGIALYRRLRNK